MRPCGGKRCPELKKKKPYFFLIIISNLESTHYPIQPLSFSFPNFMAAHGVGVAQAKPACKHTIATRKCYQYNNTSYRPIMLIYYYFIYLNIYRECVRANSCSVLCNKMFSRIFESLPLKQTKLPYRPLSRKRHCNRE